MSSLLFLAWLGNLTLPNVTLLEVGWPLVITEQLRPNTLLIYARQILNTRLRLKTGGLEGPDFYEAGGS